MLYDIGLILTVAVGGWLALDYAMAEDWNRRSPATALLGAFVAVWAGGEILLAAAGTPDQLASARRLLFLGVYGGTFCWTWVALGASPPGWFRRDPRRIFALAVPLALFYSTLFWAPDGTLVALRTPGAVYGPLFFVSATYCWSLVLAGLLHYRSSAFRLGRVSRTRAALLLAAIAVPLGLNVIYTLGLTGPTDPTPALLGVTALMIRIGLVDPGLAVYLPLARKDIVEQLTVGVVVADIDGRVIDANGSARQLLRVDEAVGESLDALCERLDETVEVLRFPLRSHVAVTGSAAVLTDRREAVEAERRLQIAGRLQAVGSLTAGMAHEINNPLAFVRSNLNLIEKLISELVAPETNARLSNPVKALALDGAESLVDAKDGIERISLLVARLKDFARQTQTTGTRSSRVDLRQAAERAATLARVGVAEEAIHVVAGEPAIVSSEEPVIVQILLNLVLNAVQASGPEPDVTVEVGPRGDELEVRVSDRGSGLTAEDLERIFDPFYTTKEAGSGLGLTISYELARQLGGRIEAANRADGGARFSLILPRRSAPAA